MHWGIICETVARGLTPPSDVASGARYLASEEAAFITGVEFPVDGSRSGPAHHASHRRQEKVHFVPHSSDYVLARQGFRPDRCLFHVATGGGAEKPGIFPGKLRHTFITHIMRSNGDRRALQQKAPGFDQSQLLLKLQGAERSVGAGHGAADRSIRRPNHLIAHWCQCCFGTMARGVLAFLRPMATDRIARSAVLLSGMLFVGALGSMDELSFYQFVDRTGPVSEVLSWGNALTSSVDARPFEGGPPACCQWTLV